MRRVLILLMAVAMLTGVLALPVAGVPTLDKTSTEGYHQSPLFGTDYWELTFAIKETKDGADKGTFEWTENGGTDVFSFEFVDDSLEFYQATDIRQATFKVEYRDISGSAVVGWFSDIYDQVCDGPPADGVHIQLIVSVYPLLDPALRFDDVHWFHDAHWHGGPASCAFELEPDSAYGDLKVKIYN